MDFTGFGMRGATAGLEQGLLRMHEEKRQNMLTQAAIELENKRIAEQRAYQQNVLMGEREYSRQNALQNMLLNNPKLSAIHSETFGDQPPTIESLTKASSIYGKEEKEIMEMEKEKQSALQTLEAIKAVENLPIGLAKTELDRLRSAGFKGIPSGNRYEVIKARETIDKKMEKAREEAPRTVYESDYTKVVKVGSKFFTESIPQPGQTPMTEEEAEIKFNEYKAAGIDAQIISSPNGGWGVTASYKSEDEANVVEKLTDYRKQFRPVIDAYYSASKSAEDNMDIKRIRDPIKKADAIHNFAMSTLAQTGDDKLMEQYLSTFNNVVSDTGKMYTPDEISAYIKTDAGVFSPHQQGLSNKLVGIFGEMTDFMITSATDDIEEHKDPANSHSRGMAIDIRLPEEFRTPGKSNTAISMIKAAFAKDGIDIKVINGYIKKIGTGKHLHIQFKNPKDAEKYLYKQQQKTELANMAKADDVLVEMANKSKDGGMSIDTFIDEAQIYGKPLDERQIGIVRKAWSGGDQTVPEGTGVGYGKTPFTNRFIRVPNYISDPDMRKRAGPIEIGIFMDGLVKRIQRLPERGGIFAAGANPEFIIKLLVDSGVPLDMAEEAMDKAGYPRGKGAPRDVDSYGYGGNLSVMGY